MSVLLERLGEMTAYTGQERISREMSFAVVHQFE